MVQIWQQSYWHPEPIVRPTIVDSWMETMYFADFKVLLLIYKHKFISAITDLLLSINTWSSLTVLSGFELKNTVFMSQLNEHWICSVQSGRWLGSVGGAQIRWPKFWFGNLSSDSFLLESMNNKGNVYYFQGFICIITSYLNYVSCKIELLITT